MIKAVVFDIGETLVRYNKPLNWSKLYRPALRKMADDCNIKFSENDYENAIYVLKKYNTRIKPREKEVSSDTIFNEIIEVTNHDISKIEEFKGSFYSFFRNDAVIFPEVEDTLKKLNAKRIVVGTLTDVAYGMDNKYALEDIALIIKYIQYPYTSNDIGYRKPNAKGLQLIANQLELDTKNIIFVGDEMKDIQCAENAGAVSVLINRNNEKKNFGQDYEISNLQELLGIINNL